MTISSLRSSGGWGLISAWGIVNTCQKDPLFHLLLRLVKSTRNLLMITYIKPAWVVWVSFSGLVFSYFLSNMLLVFDITKNNSRQLPVLALRRIVYIMCSSRSLQDRCQRTLSKLSRNQTWQPPITKQEDDVNKTKKSRHHASWSNSLLSLAIVRKCDIPIFIQELLYCH